VVSVLFFTRIKVRKAIEAEFNRWYDEEHIPDILAFRGAVSVRRYRAVLDEMAYQLLTITEFRDEATLRRFLTSDHRRRLTEEFDARYGQTTERVREGWEQIWP